MYDKDNCGINIIFVAQNRIEALINLSVSIRIISLLFFLYDESN